LEVLVADHVVDQVRALILEAASTGKIGDGKIFVYHMDEVLRIRTGERGPQAV
jgi:nitrogen regulatory protein P-II 1